MAREIDILLEAARRDQTVVDKASNVLWSRSELELASAAGCYRDEDRLAPPGAADGVSGPFPGCLQRFAAPPDIDRYRLVGETEHFLVFAPPV